MEDSVLGGIAVRDGMAICPCRTGEVVALALKDGAVLWRALVSGNSPIVAGCAFTAERIYALSGDGYVAALAPKTGELLEKVFVNDKGAPGSGLSMSTPVVVVGRLVIGSETGGMRCYAGRVK